ncbi:hypothetical protein MIMGU_mgv11b023746mg [Erythranthe guttata]|uniref:Response regulatory domain-containing protein n=1 Tax=Erythranthe guttata TaxID=4155 RepID=A0A022RPE6_ERYGU|nr:PREDICTED: two-component response regulator ARR12-like [Erythranthe guttata]EYU40815.1 hypothetical protein MIMGU_mgv11b023746mg [Erythranthe guttata]|eukprot:XP_012833306.1 PREDICTED: two-component response regulator ARR12-like [Erythranthe guttata]
MSDEKTSAVPTPFRGVRVLLVDNDTLSLLNMASELEDYSYRVTTTELATVALSILRERTDHFDLIMADTNMREIDFFKFIENVHLIKNLPIILMAKESNKDTVKEAMEKGACFFLEKPISSKTLKNVWQHVYRKRTNEKEPRGVVKSIINADQEVESRGANVGGGEEGDKILEIVKESTLQEHGIEEVGDSDQVENDLENLVDRKRLTEVTEICMKRCVPTESDGLGKFIMRKRIKQSSCESSSPVQSKFSTKKKELVTELASSSNSIN